MKFDISKVSDSVKKLNPSLTEKVKVKKPSKYGNIRTEVDGYSFASVLEAKRYIFLRWQLEQGILSYLFLQYPFELNQGGTHSLIYLADFVYGVSYGNKRMIVEDAKGMRTREFNRKARLMKKIYNIDIKLT